MKLREIFRFEFAYQVRRVWTWFFFAVLVVFAFLLTRNGMLADALREDFFLNSPFVVAKTTVICSLLWLLVAAVVAGDAAARDVATGMHPLTYTAPVSKADYLGGRFLAAFVPNALMLLAVQASILLAVYAPGVEGATIGPFRPSAYVTAYAFIALPNAFVATAIQFSLAARNGRAMASYLGSVLRAWLPSIGYQRSRELSSARDRRAHGLAPRPWIPSLDDVEARQDMPAAEGIDFEAVIGTDGDQIAVAPGALA